MNHGMIHIQLMNMFSFHTSQGKDEFGQEHSLHTFIFIQLDSPCPYAAYAGHTPHTSYATNYCSIQSGHSITTPWYANQRNKATVTYSCPMAVSMVTTKAFGLLGNNWGATLDAQHAWQRCTKTRDNFNFSQISWARCINEFQLLPN